MYIGEYVLLSPLESPLFRETQINNALTYPILDASVDKRPEHLLQAIRFFDEGRIFQSDRLQPF